jgi:predicted  nucleic acid-binding Zn-ribbon protein
MKKEKIIKVILVVVTIILTIVTFLLYVIPQNNKINRNISKNSENSEITEYTVNVDNHIKHITLTCEDGFNDVTIVTPGGDSIDMTDYVDNTSYIIFPNESGEYKIIYPSTLNIQYQIARIR